MSRALVVVRRQTAFRLTPGQVAVGGGEVVLERHGVDELVAPRRAPVSVDFSFPMPKDRLKKIAFPIQNKICKRNKVDVFSLNVKARVYFSASATKEKCYIIYDYYFLGVYNCWRQ